MSNDTNSNIQYDIGLINQDILNDLLNTNGTAIASLVSTYDLNNKDENEINNYIEELNKKINKLSDKDYEWKVREVQITNLVDKINLLNQILKDRQTEKTRDGLSTQYVNITKVKPTKSSMIGRFREYLRGNKVTPNYNIPNNDNRLGGKTRRKTPKKRTRVKRRKQSKKSRRIRS